MGAVIHSDTTMVHSPSSGTTRRRCAWFAQCRAALRGKQSVRVAAHRSWCTPPRAHLPYGHRGEEHKMIGCAVHRNRTDDPGCTIRQSRRHTSFATVVVLPDVDGKHCLPRLLRRLLLRRGWLTLRCSAPWRHFLSAGGRIAPRQHQNRNVQVQWGRRATREHDRQRGACDPCPNWHHRQLPSAAVAALEQRSGTEPASRKSCGTPRGTPPA